MLRLNEPMLSEWKSCDGDNTKLLDYDLNENSKILELGGYDGTWIKKIISRYNPFVYVIEPVPLYYNNLKKEFSSNRKFNIMDVAVSENPGSGTIYLNSDSTSVHVKKGKPIEIKLETIEKILDNFGADVIDLIQINIEGEEYKLLENLLESGNIARFKNLQVQFHIGMPDYERRRDLIQEGLIKNGFVKNFDFPFIWEGWSKFEN